MHDRMFHASSKKSDDCAPCWAATRSVSRFLEIAFPDVTNVMSPFEELAQWGDERLPFEPRRFRFGSLALSVVPVPAHLLPWMSVATCVEVSPDVVYDWTSQRDAPAVVADIRRLLDLATARASWVVVYESDRGDGVCELAVEPARLFDCVDTLLRGEGTASLTIVRPVHA
jgi:hypothetical protein